jgi:transcriptional regulator with XRE-family HTH domain
MGNKRQERETIVELAVLERNIKMRLVQLGMSFTALAEREGIVRQTMRNRIVKASKSYDQLHWLAGVLGVTTDYLTGTGEPSQAEA